MNVSHAIRHRRGFAVLGVLVLSLLLRADGCTSDRELTATVPVTLEVPWTTTGFTQSSGTSAQLTRTQIDDVFDALDEADLDAVRAAIDAGAPVRIAGASAVITRNDGHVAARSGEVSIAVPGNSGEIAFRVDVPTNVAGTEASAVNGGISFAASGNGAQYGGLTVLAVRLNQFVDRYLDGDRDGAADVLLGIEFSATWTSTPPPTQLDPDDFDWVTSITILIPTQYDVEVPNL